MPPGVSRRQALALLGGAAAGVVGARWFDSESVAQVDCGPTTTTLAPTTSTTGAGIPLWSTLGLAGHVVLPPGDVLLDVDATVDSLRIPAGSRLIFDPNVSHTLTSRGNITVEGILETRPASPAVVHDVSFVGINEAGFVGGGMDPIASDVGLWIMGAGLWDAVGTPKQGWSRLTQGAAARQTTLTVDSAAGWQPGDRLTLTPTGPPGPADWHPDHPRTPNFASRYSDTTIASVDGNTVTVAPLTNAHPTALAGLGAEVMNLSRNVRVHGEPGKRAHVFVRSGAQHVSHVELFNVAPRKGTAAVLGRYGLHVHMCGDLSRGSVYEGVTVHDAGSHAYVPHLSNGVTFRDCVSHNTFDDAYWWDPRPNNQSPGPPTNDVLYDRCVASWVRFDKAVPAQLRLAGFNLGEGTGNTLRDSVAVGVEGTYGGVRQRSGFLWPEGPQSVWVFDNNVAHNNGDSGIFGWQNTHGAHVITRFTGYHNGAFGIEHGAYFNHYHFEDSLLYGNLMGAIALRAVSGFPNEGPLVFRNVTCDGAGLSDYLVLGREHAVIPPQIATRFENCTFRRAKKAAFGFINPGVSNRPPDILDVIDSTFDGNQLWLASNVDSRDLIRFVNGSSIVNARRYDQPGTLRPEWNARVN